MSITSIHQELEFLKTIPIHWLVKIGMSVLCGAIFGLERELNRKAAGLRTNVLICMGATLYMLLSDLILSQSPTLGGDATRIAGQVVVGMGFIGGGAIIQSRGQVIGLTTAAVMWVVAAIGLVIGAGFPLLGLIVTVFAVIMMILVGKLEYSLMGKCRFSMVKVSFRDDPKTWDLIRELFAANRKKIEETSVAKEKGVCFMEVAYCNVHPEHKEFLVDLLNIPDVRHASL
ncbi:MAG: MgtC/SapB family protein [bacterium]|nr:MgtC/SapB family protein [bacterium]